MKIAVIPKRDISFHHHFYRDTNFRFFFRNFYERLNFKFAAYEILYYAELAKINENTFFLGGLHREYLKKNIPSYTTNPSAHNLHQPKRISLKKLKKELRNFDALLVSIDSFNFYKDLIKNAKNLNIIVAIIDHPDQEDIYHEKEKSLLFKGLSKGKDFDLYFKKDIPKGMLEDDLYPLAPDPIKIENFEDIKRISMNNKKNDFFFSGVLNKPITYENRKDILEVFNSSDKSHITTIDINNHYKRELLSHFELIENMAQSKFILSPSGRSWTTTRHTMSAVTYSCPVIPTPDCETVKMNFEDNHNVITYPMLRYLGENDRKKEALSLKDKLRYLNDAEAERISENWREEVLSHHTTLERSKYILNTIKKYI